MSPSTCRTPKNPLGCGGAATRTAVRAGRAHLLPDPDADPLGLCSYSVSWPFPYRGRLALVVTGVLLQDVQGFGLGAGLTADAGAGSGLVGIFAP